MENVLSSSENWCKDEGSEKSITRIGRCLLLDSLPLLGDFPSAWPSQRRRGAWTLASVLLRYEDTDWLGSRDLFLGGKVGGRVL